MPFEPKVFCCTSNMIEGREFPVNCSAFWLHGDDKDSVERLLLFSEKLLISGVKFFHLTGKNAVETHDRVDDIIIDQGHSNTLTTWHEGSLKSAASEFWDLTLTSHETMGIIVFAKNINREIEIMSEILKFTHKNLSDI